MGISAVTGAHFSSINFPLIDTKNEEVYNLIRFFLITEGDSSGLAITILALKIL